MSFPVSRLTSLKTFMLILVQFFLLVVCHTESKKIISDLNKPIEEYRKEFTLVTPQPDQKFALGQEIHFLFKSQKKIATIDSVEIYLDGYLIHTEIPTGFAFTDKTLFEKVGRQTVRLKIYYDQKSTETLTTSLIILSDITPVILKFETIRKLKHDTLSYTQGLVYHNGFIYEGTGLEGRSKIRKIEPQTGNVLMERKIDDDFFGEGIVILDNKIFQLTYKSKVGFVYNLETFEMVRKFDMQTNEGWGMTTDGQNLIISDGSAFLYYFNPKDFTLVSQLNVCDQNGPVSRLNELEFVNGYIWANVYGKSQVLKIDSRTGMVVALLDLKGITPKGIPENYDYVLNGIAYNSESKTFFVTGKLWPDIFEIKTSE